MPSSAEKGVTLSSGASDALHWLRVALAFLVLVSHCRGHLLVDYSALREPTLGLRVLYFMTGFGSIAVTGFFVLSGFLITRRYFEPLRNGEITPFAFLGGRAVRLYLVLLPVLVFSGFLVRFSPVRGALGWDTLVYNALFLQPASVAYYANNAPLWSLGYEAWAYVSFCGLTCAVVDLRGRKYVGLLWGALGLLPFATFSIWTLHYFLLWAVGGLCALPRVSRLLGGLGAIRPRPRWLVSCALALGGIVVARLGVPMPWRDYLVAVPLGLCLALLTRVELVVPARLAKIGRRGSEMSYSLYLTHYPWVLLVETRFGGEREPTFGAIGAVLALSLGCASFAFVFAWCTERHTGRVRRFFGWGGRKAALSAG